jgi:hypothetical protein
MADFFSQFQVHPPGDFNLGGFQPAPSSNTPQLGDPRYGVGGMGYEGGMGGGSYLPIGNYTGPTGAASAGIGVDTAPPMQLPDWAKNGNYAPNDPSPRLSPLPQPWQQGPGVSSPPNDFPNLGGVSPQMPSLGPAAQMGPNGATFTNGQGQSTDQFGTPLANGIGQPMNPSQQSGMVLMRSPDGLHMQNVPQAHVDHYTGLGATQVTGPQLTGSSYVGSF